MSLFLPDANPHEPTETCMVWHCHFHGVDEHLLGPYLKCRECGHRYRNERDLRRDYRDGARPLGRITWLVAALTPASRIRFCAHCIHDI